MAAVKWWRRRRSEDVMGVFTLNHSTCCYCVFCSSSSSLKVTLHLRWKFFCALRAQPHTDMLILHMSVEFRTHFALLCAASASSVWWSGMERNWTAVSHLWVWIHLLWSLFLWWTITIILLLSRVSLLSSGYTVRPFLDNFDPVYGLAQ